MSKMRTQIFQSTLSVRRATFPFTWFSVLSIFQSTLSVRRATVASFDLAAAKEISIHALRKESDLKQLTKTIETQQFQSTLSVRRATDGRIIRCVVRVYFNPRSP